MKIGILTLHSQTNYGGVLQAFALQRACKKVGKEAEIIDYRFKCHPALSLDSPFQRLQMGLAKGLYRFLREALLSGFVVQDLTRRKRTRRFLLENMELSEKTYRTQGDLAQTDHYDVIVVGSDQVWSPKIFPSPNPYLMGWAPDRIRRVAYAASLGAKAIPADRLDEYCEGLRRFSRITVREQEAQTIISEIVDKPVNWVLDPTLLHTAEEWEKMLGIRAKEDGSVFCYWLGDIQKLMPLLRDITERRRQRVRLVMFWPSNVSRRQALRLLPWRIYLALNPRIRCCFSFGPREFVEAIASSSYVLGTSFHALMFATIFHKKTKIFLDSASGMMNKSARMVDFCRTFNCQDVLQEQVPKSLAGTGSRGFARIDVDLSSMRKRSLKALGDMLS